METEAMNLFLSEENIRRHKEHLHKERLKYSILEKSEPQLKEKKIKEILRMNIGREVKDEAILRLSYIKAHECFFSSFFSSKKQSILKKSNLASEKLLYDIFLCASEKEHCFLFLYSDRKGNIRWLFSNLTDGAFIKYHPQLALDLYEHTYFLDYGFDKKRFLRNALAHLNLSSLDNGDKKGYNNKRKNNL